MISIDDTGGVVTVSMHLGGTDVPLEPLWLRERSTSPSQFDATSSQRLFDPHRLDPELSIAEAHLDDGSLVVRFSDGHNERFDERAIADFPLWDDGLPSPTSWTADSAELPRHAWNDIDGHDADSALLGAVSDFLRLGAIVITGVPNNDGAVATVASKFGYIRETNFGRVFDVRSVPDANDLAYTSVALSPHTDNPYRIPVPGIQLLHCLSNETSGGASTLVDSMAVVDRLRDENIEWYEILATTPVQFRFRDATTDLRSLRTVIDTNDAGTFTGLNYSPRLDHSPLLSPERTKLFQRARRRLAELLSDPTFEMRLRLRPGEVEMFANDRVLHGRSAYDPQEGIRHLQGCYIDADAPRSLYRVLTRGVL
jgi:gamma-butyrobetaine dioxygenase